MKESKLEAAAIPRKRHKIENEEDNVVAPEGVVSAANLIAYSAGSSQPLHIPDILAQVATRFNPAAVPYTKSESLPNEAKISHLKTLCVRNLPEWVTVTELKDVFMRLSAAGLESMFTIGHHGQQIITNIQIARDPDSQKCIGYALVEFTEHAVAAEMLATLPGPKFCLHGSNKQLTLHWAQGPITPSSILDNYHFYIGNLKPGLSERSVLQVLKTLHPAIASVRLLPLEILGYAPNYVEYRDIPEDDLENKEGQVSIASAFYCAAPHVPPQTERLTPLPERSGERRWGAGFIRLIDEHVPDWKVILRTLRAKLNSEAGFILRREPFTPSAVNAPLDEPHASVAIVLRPVFGKFDNTVSMGFRYTGGVFPKMGGKKKRQNAGGSFPQASPLVTGASGNNTSASSALHEEESPYGPQSKTSLFIGNLSEDTTDEDMSRLVSPFGLVLSSRVAFLKHVAFVELGDHRSALAALSHLRDTTFKRNKLQLDWGRIRPLQAPALKSMSENLSAQNQAQLEEKAFARQMVQSMQPNIKTKNAILPNDQVPEAREPTPQERAFWLSSLCAMLPNKSTEKQDKIAVLNTANDVNIQKDTC